MHLHLEEKRKKKVSKNKEGGTASDPDYIRRRTERDGHINVDKNEGR